MLASFLASEWLQQFRLHKRTSHNEKGRIVFHQSLNKELPFTLIGVHQNKLCGKKMPCVLIGLDLYYGPSLIQLLEQEEGNYIVHQTITECVKFCLGGNCTTAVFGIQTDVVFLHSPSFIVL